MIFSILTEKINKADYVIPWTWRGAFLKNLVGEKFNNTWKLIEFGIIISNQLPEQIAL